MQFRKIPSVFALGLLSFALGAQASSSLSFYTERYLNSSEYVYTDDYANSNLGYGYVRDYTGAAVEYGWSGSRTWAYSNGSGGYVIRPEASDVYAGANLSTGELKASAYLYSGVNQADSAASPAFGVRSTGATATASFADTLSFASGGNSYIWGSGETFTFNMAVDGQITLPAGHATPLSSTAMTWATLNLWLYRPGGLQAVQNIDDFYDNIFDYAGVYGWDAASAEASRLNSIVNSFSIGRAGWCLGGNLTLAGWCGGSFYQQVTLDANGEGEVNYSFAPGGDFEFVLQLETDVSIDLSYEDIWGELDFSHTVEAGFTAPDDATVYSASGRFPNTLALGTNPGTVPEPGTLALLVIGLGAAGMRRRRA
jgi:hypothetical protein